LISQINPRVWLGHFELWEDGEIIFRHGMALMTGEQPTLAQAAAMQPGTLRIIVSGQTMNRAMQAGLRNGEIHHYFEKQHSYEPVQACIRDWLDAQPGK
jgi:hypothetical protein